MGYKLNVSKDAHNDVVEIAGYIKGELDNPKAASTFLDDVEKGYRNAVDNPRMYGLCYDERLRRKGYRKIIIKNYLLFYRVDEAQKTVFVVRVIYGARDYTKLL